LLEQVLAVLGAPATVLTRGVRTDLDRALRALALAPLEEELLLFPTATLAVGPGVTRHCLDHSCFSWSDAAALRRAAAVVRGRGDVLDRTHLEAGGLEG